MKTIAVTVDEMTLRLLDELATSEPQRRTRSALVRTALKEFVERERRRSVAAGEPEVFRSNHKLLTRQARVLIKGQARP